MSKAIAKPFSLGPLFDLPALPPVHQPQWESQSFPRKTDFRSFVLPGNGPQVLAIDWADGPPSLHDWLEWLRSRLATKPRILFGWSADPLQGELGFRESFLRIVRATLRWGMQVCIRTEMALDESESLQLKSFGPQLKFLVPLLGFAPSSSELARLPNRLEALRLLKARGFSPKIALEPMIPGIHDRPEVISKVLSEVAIFSPSSMQVGFLTLPEDRRGTLLTGPLEIAKKGGYAEAYTEGPSIEIKGSRVRLLPLAARQKAFARIHSMAAVKGIRVDICPWTNPDFVQKKPAPTSEVPYRGSLLKRFLELSLPS